MKVSRGRLFLNGRPVNFRGVGVHEDTRTQGFAVDDAFRERLVSEAQGRRGDVLRTHYPMHPYIHELADREGLLIWSEIPVYAVKTLYLRQETVRALAAKEMRRNVETNLNHPSVFTWSVGNELSSKPGPVQGDYIRRAAEIAKDIDPTRPTSIAFAGYPSAGCQTEYAPLDIVGVNEYFGWYPGPGGKLFDRTGLGPYLDSVRRCYPRHGDRGDRVRRRGQPRRPGGGEGHLRLPAGLRQLPHERAGRASRGSAAWSTGRSTSSGSSPTGRAATRARSRRCTRRAC